MKREDAAAMKKCGVRAIEELTDLLNIAVEKCSPKEYEQIRRGVGLSIGRITVDLLDIIYQQLPEIDHLARRHEPAVQEAFHSESVKGASVD